MPRFMLLSVVALVLTGCGLAPPSSNPDAVAVAESVTIEGTRGLVLAELAYNTAAKVTLASVENGLLKGDAIVRARVLNTAAMEALERAKSAQTKAAQALAVAEAIDAITDLKGLTENRP